MTKEDAINKENRLTKLHAPIEIRLVDSKGKKTGWKNIKCNSSGQSVSFTVTADMDYYVELDFNTGYYHSGSFTVSK